MFHAAAIGIVLGLLFVSPAYFILKGRGYRPARYISVSVLIGVMGAVLSATFHPGWAWLLVLSPAVLFIVARLLPTRKGAPGDTYLRMTFDCPQCGKSVSFPRSKEGKTVYCPECEDIITVPWDSADGALATLNAHLHIPAEAEGDVVSIGTFYDENKAEIVRERLAAQDIPAFIVGDAISHVYPPVKLATGGVRLMISTEDLDRVRVALSIPESELALPEDFVPPPVDEPSEARWPGCMIGLAIATAATFLFMFFSPVITAWLTALTIQPSQSFILTPAQKDIRVVVQIQEILSTRFQTAKIPYKLQRMAGGQLKLSVDVTGPASTNLVIRLIQQPGILGFHLVHEDNDKLTGRLFDEKQAPPGYHIVATDWREAYQPGPGTIFPPTNPEDKEALRNFSIPDPSYEFTLQRQVKEGQVTYRPYFIERRPLMAGQLKSAEVCASPLDKFYVAIEFDRKGTRRFAEITRDHAPGGEMNVGSHVGRCLAIVVDGVLLSAPAIMEEIQGGKAQITGIFTPQEAGLLAAVLNAAPLPCTVRVTPLGEAAQE